jgi:RHS repeat-associated protein
VVYTLGYGYDAVGNRTSLSKDGTAYTFVYDDNNKMTSASGNGLSASFGYDGAGNMTSVTGTMYQNKTLTFNDESRLASVAYGGVTDTYTYNWEGLRTRAYLNGAWCRYLYNGERVLQDLTNAGAVNATYTTENDSYYGTLLHLKRASGESRFPLYDEIGSARGLVDAGGTVTDTYDMDTFGAELDSTVTTPNPYRFGAAWGYITDPSGLLQLGARFYWPEVGRFVSQDPIRDEINLYLYGRDAPLSFIDPAGLKKNPCPDPKKPKDPCKECTEKYKKGLQDCVNKFKQNALVSGGTAAAGGGSAASRGGCGSFLAYAIGLVKYVFDLNAYADCLQREIDKYKSCWASHKCKGSPPGASGGGGGSSGAR